MSAGLLAVIAGFVLGGQWLLYKESQATLAQRFNEVREEVGKLEAVAAGLEGFRQKVNQLEERLNPHRTQWFHASAVEAKVKDVARAVGLRVADTSVATSKKAGHSEATLTLSVEGSQAAVERFATRVAGLSWLYRVDDVLLPASQGTIRLRAFAMPWPAPAALDECVVLLSDSYPSDPYPSWLFSLEERRQQLQRACWRRQQLAVIRKQVAEFQAKERYLQEATRLVEEIRALPPARIETEYVPSRLTIAEVRVSALEPEGQTFTARVVAPNQKTLRLHAGDRVADGLVKSIAKDHVIVEKEVTVAAGKPAVKRQLRLAPRQQLPPIPLGHDTTRITAPLFARPDPRHGTPDYLAWLNEKYGAGVTRENNAAGRLHAALDGLVDAGQSFFDELLVEKRTWRPMAAPWSEKDCPSCARRLEKNEKSLAEIAEAVLRPRYFLPAPPGAPASGLWLPSPLLKLRWAANALAGRGMLRLGRGDLKGAAEDALTGQRLALLIGQGPQVIQQLIAIALRGIGASLVPSIAGAPSLAPEDARRFLRELQALPQMPSLPETIDRYERFHALDQILLLRLIAPEVGPGGMLAILEPDWFPQVGEALKLDPVVYLIPTAAFDWEEALRLVNRGFDLSVSALRATTPAERRRTRAEAEAESRDFGRQRKAALETLKKSVRSEQTAPVNIAEAAEALARTPEGRKQLAHLLVSREDQRFSLASNEAEACFRLDVTAVALAVERLEKGRYPEKLDALASDLLPGRFAPSAPTPGYVLSYRTAPAKAGPGAYALTAVPEEAKVTGNRGFCVDSTGAMRFTTDGTAPKIANGICDPQVPLLR